jgi:hypothetical protein
MTATITAPAGTTSITFAVTTERQVALTIPTPSPNQLREEEYLDDDSTLSAAIDRWAEDLAERYEEDPEAFEATYGPAIDEISIETQVSMEYVD